MKVTNDGTIHVALDNHDAIEPCPFCGSVEVELANTWTPSYWVECKGCGAEVHPHGPSWKKGDDTKPAKHLASARRAMKAWNRREAA